MGGRRNHLKAGHGAALALALLTGGCASAVSGVYGDAATQDPATVVQASPDAAPIRVQMDPDAECPMVNIPTGASAWASGGGQVTIAEFARECTLNPGNVVTIKVGIEGLALAGERGGSGNYSAPLRVWIRDRAGNTVYSRVHRVSVPIPPGQAQGKFRLIDDGAQIPISQTTPLASYEIQVGFGGEGAAPPRRKRRG